MCATAATPMPLRRPFTSEPLRATLHPAACVARLFQTLADRGGIDGMATDPAIALLKDVFQTYLNRIDAESLGDFVDLRFAREACLRIAKAAECAGTQLIGVNDFPDAARVRNTVRTGGEIEREHHDGRTVVRICAAIHDQIELLSNESTVTLDARLDPHQGGVPRAHRQHVLASVEHDLDRTASALRQQHRERLDRRFRFRAEAAADARPDRADTRAGQPEAVGNIGLGAEHALRRRPHRDLALGLDLGDGRDRLEIGVILRLRLVDVFDDEIALCPSFPDIAGRNFRIRQNVAVADRGENLEIAVVMLVQDRRVGCHRLFWREHGRQFLIFDLDEARCLLRSGETGRRHCRNRLAAIANAILWQDGFVLDEKTHVAGFEIGAGDDSLNAGDGERLRYVVGHNARVTVRTADNHSEQHAGKRDVVGILRVTCRLAERLEPGHGRADHLANDIHALAPLGCLPFRAAATRIASTTFT